MNLPDFISEYSALFNAIHKVVPPSMKIYLVGGAVRDILLERPIRDFDFTVEGLVRPIGKHIADELNGAYYVLDDEREMVRVIIDDEQMGQFDIDIALLTGDSIEDDLRDRDFTFNAMAIQISDPPELIDPLGGWNDLQNKRLRMCNSHSLSDDPLRSMRAVRMSLEFGLEMDAELLAAMYETNSKLSASSMERYRDELFKIIRLYQNGKALRKFEEFRFLDHLFPDWYNEFSPEVEWIENTDLFCSLLTYNRNVNELKDDFIVFATSRLGNYKEALINFFDRSIALYHNRRMLTSFASIAFTLTKGIDIIKPWCSRLAFSSSETNFVLNAIASFIRIKTLGDPSPCGDVEIYRFFNQYKEGGLAGLILFLADGYGQKNEARAYQIWCDKVVFVQNLVSAYFTRYMEVISPVPMLTGHDIQELLGIPAGPIIGVMKNSLIEAQIRGSVETLDEAKSFLRQQIKHYS